MLTLAKVEAGGAAASYYEEADDYYHQDRAPSQWWGAGAQALGLQGEVKAETFRALLDGHMPDGSQLHNAAEGRRGGTDLTFSAPKSVSMQALIAGDPRLIDAHERAVAQALGYAQGLVSYRITAEHQTHSEASGNVLVAAFRHDLSRALDPNLHTHAVVINATQRPDGAWRASQHGELYRQQKLIGALYRAELALQVRELGYTVRLTHADGRFELAHINDTQVEVFSQRSRAVEERLAAQGLSREDATARQKEVANLATREAKTQVDRPSLRQTWLQSSAEHGVNYGAAELTDAREPLRLDPEQVRAAAERAVGFALAHQAERQAVFTHSQLLRSALERGTGGANLPALEREIERQVQAGQLLRAGTHYTTEAAQTREREILAVAAQGRSAVAPILSSEAAQRSLQGSRLNAGQCAAATLILSTADRISAIQGSAGTGKTTMLRKAQALAQAQGYRVLGLAPSAAAVQELHKAGLASQTVAAFTQRERAGIDSKTLLVLDEAGMVSARDMHRVLQQIEAAGARVVLLGDVQQLKAVEAGRPFAQLQEAGVARVEMGEIQRQTDALLREAVQLAAQGQTPHALQRLRQRVVEIEADRPRHQAIARDYVQLSPEARAQTLILAGTHAARESINHQVRAALDLAGRGLSVPTLQAKDLTREQARMSLSYQVGDWVQAQKTYPSLGLTRGEQAQVVEIGGGRVCLQRADGQRIDWRPALQPHLSVYSERQRELAVGDVVRVTANDHGRGLVNGERATVTGIDPEQQRLQLTRANGEVLSLDARRAQHLDHGYCATVHAAQGQTAERVLYEADTRSATVNESSFYVAISRARSEVTLYTEDASQLPQSLVREDTKSAALDLPAPTPPGPEAKRQADRQGPEAELV